MSLDLTKLQTTLDGETDIICRRDFGHPPAKVWRALTEPALIRQWMAVDGHPMTRCDIDPRPGGSFHYEWAGPDGTSFFFSGPILAVDAPRHMTISSISTVTRRWPRTSPPTLPRMAPAAG